MGFSQSLPALDVRPPAAPPSPLDEFARVAQIKSQMQAQQAQRQEFQVRQQQLKDQQATTAAMNNWDASSGDYDALAKSVLAYGGSANAATAIQQHGLDVRTKMAALTKDERDNFVANRKTIGDQLETLKDVPDDQLHGTALNTVMGLMHGGLLKGPEAQQAVQLIQTTGDPTELRNKIHLIAQTNMGASAVAAQKKTAAETEEATQKAAQAKAEAGKADIETQNLQQGLSPQLMEAKYVRLQQLKNMGAPIPAQDAAFMKAYEKQKTLVPTANFNLQNAGIAGTQVAPSAIAKGLADGSIKWGDVVSARTPAATKEALLSEVKRLKPDFNSGDFQIEQDVRKNFTSGEGAKNLTNFNTAIEHASQLKTAADALNNGDIRGLNAIGNKLGYEFGSDKTTNFNVIKNALAGEISKVFKGGQATDAEIKSVEQPFEAANSPAQLKGAIDNAIKLMNSKRDALKQQYDAGRQGQPNFGNEAKPQAGGKVLSMAAVQKAARDHNVSIDEAKRQAQAAGYTIQ